MTQELQTVLLSLATSLVVSLITFILGLKSGKNQTDRAKLQSIYRDLYSHFSDLRDSLEQNRPKTWEHYKKVERGLYSTEYYPPVKELKRSGDILFLKKKLADQALNLEMQIMNYSYDLKCKIPEIHAALISNLEIYQEGYKFINYRGNSNDTSHFETANPKKCNSFWPRNYRDLIERQKIIKLLQDMDASQTTALEFTSGDNPITYSAKLYPGGIKINIDQYVEHLFTKFEKEVPGFNELCNQKNHLITKIDKLRKRLARKAKEPVSFWETMFGAFGDMFR